MVAGPSEMTSRCAFPLLKRAESAPPPAERSSAIRHASAPVEVVRAPYDCWRRRNANCLSTPAPVAIIRVKRC